MPVEEPRQQQQKIKERIEELILTRLCGTYHCLTNYYAIKTDISTFLQMNLVFGSEQTDSFVRSIFAR